MNDFEGKLIIATIPPGAQQIIGRVKSMDPTRLIMDDALFIVPGKGFAKGQDDRLEIIFPQNLVVQHIASNAPLAKEYEKVQTQIRSGITLATHVPPTKERM